MDFSDCPNEGRHALLEFCADCGFSRARQEEQDYESEANEDQETPC